MKIITNLKYSPLLVILFFTGSTYAFEVGGARHYCKPPQFRDFVPAERVRNQPFIEVAPESIIAVKAMGSIDPSTIRVFAKKIVLEPTVVDKKSFFQITAKLPAELRGGFARIDLIAQAHKGECIGKDGWLIKIKEAATIAEAVDSVTAEEAIQANESNTTEKPALATE